MAAWSKLCSYDAIGEATRGHYSVARKVADGVLLADSSAQTEVRGLSETGDVRPADIFTTAALPGREQRRALRALLGLPQVGMSKAAASGCLPAS